MPSIEIHSAGSKNVKNFSLFPIIFNDPSPTHSFPWNMELNDFNSWNVLKSRKTTFLPNVHTKITLDLTTKTREIEANIDDMSFVIHLDTTPIALHLRSIEVKQIYESLLMLSSLTGSPEKKSLPVPLLDSSTPIYDAQINDFICETTNSERSSEDVATEVEKSHSNISFLIQWTITRFSLSLLEDSDPINTEFLIELEDIISSVDKQNTYRKVRMKFGTLNGVRKRLNTDGTEDLLKILARTETMIDQTQQTFFEMVLTTAMANNVHSRWGTAMSKKTLGFRELSDTLTELTITMQSIDIKLEMNILAMLFSIKDEIKQIQISTSDEVADNSINIVSVKDLPLIFFDCKGVQIWIPISDDVESGVNTDVLIAKVCIFKQI